MKKIFVALFLYIGLSLSYAQAIKFVISTPNGGTLWSMATELIPHFERWTGEKFEIEARVGGNGIAAARYVFDNKSSKTPSLYLGVVLQNFELDLTHDLVPLIDHGTLVKLMYVPGDSPVASFKELVESSKIINYGLIQVSAESEMMQEIAAGLRGKVELQEIRYKGVADIANAVLGRHLSVGASSTIGVMMLIDSGKLKPIAAQGPFRSAHYPNVPTLIEQGFRVSTQMQHRSMIWASPGIDPAVVAKIRREWAAFVQTPEGRALLKKTDHRINPAEAADPTIILNRLLKK